MCLGDSPPHCDTPAVSQLVSLVCPVKEASSKACSVTLCKAGCASVGRIVLIPQKHSRPRSPQCSWAGCIRPGSWSFELATKQEEDMYAVDRLATFIKHCAVQKLACRADKESALAAMLTTATKKASITGEPVSAVPEHSAVGGSQSNGRAERVAHEAE